MEKTTKTVFCRVLVVLGLGFSVAGCVTPMSSSQIDEITTCRNTTIGNIRKNLLLAGYEIEEQTGEDIVTEWKQTGGYGNNKSLQRITVVQLDEGQFRFKVMKRSVSVTKENQASFSTVQKNKKGNNSETMDISFGRDVERHSDFDQAYYQEYVGNYRSTQAEICGH